MPRPAERLLLAAFPAPPGSTRRTCIDVGPVHESAAQVAVAACCVRERCSNHVMAVGLGLGVRDAAWQANEGIVATQSSAALRPNRCAAILA